MGRICGKSIFRVLSGVKGTKTVSENISVFRKTSMHHFLLFASSEAHEETIFQASYFVASFQDVFFFCPETEIVPLVTSSVPLVSGILELSVNVLKHVMIRQQRLEPNIMILTYLKEDCCFYLLVANPIKREKPKIISRILADFPTLPVLLSPMLIHSYQK